MAPATHATSVRAGVVLLALVPVLSGLARGTPVPGVRVSELLIGAVGLAVLATVRGPRMDRVDYAAFAYCGATFALGALDLLGLRAGWISCDAVQTLGGPLLFLLLYRACRVALTDDGDARLVLQVVLLSRDPGRGAGGAAGARRRAGAVAARPRGRATTSSRRCRISASAAPPARSGTRTRSARTCS